MSFVIPAAAQKPPETPEHIAAGRDIYMLRCFFCHGKQGDGNGAVAPYLDPRPRDFTLGVFKLRTTASGDLPTDEDLFRTVSRGIPGTAMPAWEQILNEKERWQVVYFVKTFFQEWIDPEFPPHQVRAPNPPKRSEALIARGKEVYQEAKCWQCHGDRGRGEGPSSGELTNDWGEPIVPFNLADAWRFKGGDTIRDIFLRFTTGLNGTPMPSFADVLSERDRWALAYYVQTLERESEEAGVVLRAREVDREIPTNPDDPFWVDIPAYAIPMSGQVITRPRWQNHSIWAIYVRAAFNEGRVALRIEWDDRTMDTLHTPEMEELPRDTTDTYSLITFEEYPPYRDAIAVQFPVRIQEGPQRPHFLWGQIGQPVNLWIWKADWQAEGRDQTVEEVTATSYRNPARPHPPESQLVGGLGRWSEGTWRVVLWRDQSTTDKVNDIQFERGRVIPVAFDAWDGSNGEAGLKMSLSSWYFLVLPAASSLSVYLYSLLGITLAGGLEWWLIRMARSRQSEKAET